MTGWLSFRAWLINHAKLTSLNTLRIQKQIIDFLRGHRDYRACLWGNRNGHIQTVTGAGGGVFLHHHPASWSQRNDRIPGDKPESGLPGGYIYHLIVSGYTCHFEKYWARHCQLFYGPKNRCRYDSSNKRCHSQMQLPMSSRSICHCAPWFENYRITVSAQLCFQVPAATVLRKCSFQNAVSRQAVVFLIVDDFLKGGD